VKPLSEEAKIQRSDSFKETLKLLVLHVAKQHSRFSGGLKLSIHYLMAPVNVWCQVVTELHPAVLRRYFSHLGYDKINTFNFTGSV